MGEERDGLVLRYDYRDTDKTGRLSAEVQFDGFAGTSSAWFGEAELVGFAARLRTYPLGDTRFHLRGGYELDGGAFEEHVGLTVSAVGRRGQVGMEAHLVTPADHHAHPGSTPSEVRVEVPTTYEALAGFSSELTRMLAGTADQARLDAEVLGHP